MKNWKFNQSLALIAFTAVLTTSCMFDEDPGPIREVERDYSFSDFDRLDMGDAFNVVVEQGSEFTIHVKGDERNIEDLVVDRDGDKLKFRYRSGQRMHSRQYTTYVTITMPSLHGAALSGAVTADLLGFEETDFDLSLSGASIANVTITAQNVHFDLSGASKLFIEGSSTNMDASLAGASMLTGMDFPVENADVDLSGASHVQVNVSTNLKASASGASSVIYKGSPSVDSSLSGASTIQKN